MDAYRKLLTLPRTQPQGNSVYAHQSVHVTKPNPSHAGYKYTKYKDGVRLCSVVSRARLRGTGHNLEHRRFPLNIEKHFRAGPLEHLARCTDWGTGGWREALWKGIWGFQGGHLTLGCLRHSMASWARGGIVPLCSRLG